MSPLVGTYAEARAETLGDGAATLLLVEAGDGLADNGHDDLWYGGDGFARELEKGGVGGVAELRAARLQVLGGIVGVEAYRKAVDLPREERSGRFPVHEVGETVRVNADAGGVRQRL